MTHRTNITANGADNRGAQTVTGKQPGSARPRWATRAVAAVAIAGALSLACAAAASAAAPTSTHASHAASQSSADAQVVPVTVQPNASQAVAIPVPPNNDFRTLPNITSNNPNLVLASASYTGNQKNMIVSVMNANPRTASSGTLTVQGWGNYNITVQPNPDQVVCVDLPPNYDTRNLPVVTSNSSNLKMLSESYTYVDGIQKLWVNVGNPWPNSPATGTITVHW